MYFTTVLAENLYIIMREKEKDIAWVEMTTENVFVVG